MKIRILSALALAGALAVSFNLSALRAEPAAEKAANDRYEIMKSLWPKYYRDMSRAATGGGTDFSVITTNAPAALEQLKTFGTLFPPGSGREGAPDTRAKPEVWTQRAEFDATLQKLVAATAALNDTAKAGNADAVKAQWAKVAEACGGCHGGPPKSGGKFRFEEQ